MTHISIDIKREFQSTIQELIAALDVMHQLAIEVEGSYPTDSRDMLMGDLIMVAMLLTTSDNEISESETKLINDVRRLVYGNGITNVGASSYSGLYKELLHSYPGQAITLDHLPISVRRLQVFDDEQGTDYAEKTKALLLTFGGEVIKADKKIRPEEDITLANFKDILYHA